MKDDEAGELGSQLLAENSEAFRRFRKFSTYWPRRRKTDAWLRAEFEKMGGRPVLPFPQYFVLGVSSYISELGNDNGYLNIRIPLSEFNSDEVSFTYSDSMVSLWLSEEQREEPHFNSDLHGKVFTKEGILATVARYGIPNGEWDTDPRKAYDFFVEAQVWGQTPLQKFLNSE